HEQAVPSGRHAVGAGGTAARTDASKPALELRHEFAGLGVDDVNGQIGTIGEIVGSALLIDPADVEGVQFAAGRIECGPGDRNRLEQPYGSSIRHSLVALGATAPRGVPDWQQDRGNRKRESRGPVIPKRKRSYVPVHVTLP